MDVAVIRITIFSGREYACLSLAKTPGGLVAILAWRQASPSAAFIPAAPARVGMTLCSLGQATIFSLYLTVVLEIMSA